MTLPQTYDQHAVEELKRTIMYKGFFRVAKSELRHKLFSGQWSPVLVREVFERSNAVAVLPYDPITDQVVLIEQFRIGALGNSRSPWLLEVVAGMFEANESPEEVARRETSEEIGVALGRCEFIMNYLVSPGGTTERIHLAVGEVDSTLAQGVHGVAAEGEDLLVHVISIQQALDWLATGVIDNAATVIALQWLALNHQTLRQRWNTSHEP
jgi:ADP-ribose pyrophosphatase